MTSSKDTGSPFNKGIQHEAKHGAILSRAAKLFNTKGARATTLSDVANRLGLTKTSLYYYVKTKEDLIYQCYDASLKHAHSLLDEVEAQTKDPLERVCLNLDLHIQSILDSLSGDGDYFAAPLELESVKADHRDLLVAEYVRLFKRFRDHIKQGIEQGGIRQIDATSTARALMGALDWSFYWLYEMPEADAADAARAVRQIVTHGLLKQPEAYQPKDHPVNSDVTAPARGFDREAQNRLKQEAFFKAGTRFFNKKGFSGTSLDEIAEHLQVSKGAFYYHFANKESLLTQCYEYSLDLLSAMYDSVASSEKSPAARLDEACRRIFFLQNSDQGPLISYNTITALSPPIRRKVLTRTDEVNANLDRMIDAGKSDSSFNAVSTPVAANMLVGAINAAMDMSLWRKLDDIDAAAIDYFDVFLFGLAAPNTRVSE